MTRVRWLAGGAVVAAATGAGGFLLADDAHTAGPPKPTIELATARIEQRTLVDREQVAGTLGFDDAGTLTSGAAGTLTSAIDEGATIKRGQALYELDGKPAAWLLYGARPAWRALGPDVSNGADVKQLERSLKALGHDPGQVDRHWTYKTTAAVEAFQKARGLTQDGTLDLGQIVFASGAVRLGAAKATVGDAVRPGMPLAAVTSTRRVVAVALDADKQDLARTGARVTVELPSGRDVTGRISSVSRVAQSTRDGSTVDVTVRLARRTQLGGLDGAPVQVGLERERAKHALVVPVRALLALAGGGEGLELIGGDGARHVVRVTTGTFASDAVAVTGNGLRAGMTVGMAQ